MIKSHLDGKVCLVCKVASKVVSRQPKNDVSVQLSAATKCNVLLSRDQRIVNQELSPLSEEIVVARDERIVLRSAGVGQRHDKHVSRL